MIFGLFKGKGQSTEAPKDIHFKSSAAAFEYVEKFMPGRLIKGKILIGIVVVKHKVHSSLLAGPTQPIFTVKLAAEGGTGERSELLPYRRKAHAGAFSGRPHAQGLSARWRQVSALAG